MLFLLSPAKSLDYDTPPHIAAHSKPVFAKKSSELISVLKTQSPQQISRLMKLSASLADLNVARYQAWSSRFTPHNAKQAVLAFNGDVYGGLNARTLSAGQLDWAQDHLCILSGLYGVLRPLDLMQPYRLEMGTSLPTAGGSNLYQFWGRQISKYLNTRAAAQTAPVIVNLASEEYFKVVDLPSLKPRVVSCVFEEYKGGAYKIVSFHAKRARGLMARYAIEQQLSSVDKLRGFQAEGYGFDAAASGPDRLVFRRRRGDDAPAA
ncbi:MAG: peroxide stress protein YaaA [Polaromonas sp.]|jgi:cytoplasmic iron level regulating protein YaaA (DUF328/UPF0246 family)|nr:peroxide stress protein YaaA [Polaromonas sp.]